MKNRLEFMFFLGVCVLCRQGWPYLVSHSLPDHGKLVVFNLHVWGDTPTPIILSYNILACLWEILCFFGPALDSLSKNSVFVARPHATVAELFPGSHPL